VTIPSFENTPILSWILFTTGFLVNVLASVLVGYAARDKDRSFRSFLLLSLLFGFPIPALVVAALPFDKDDPRRPKNKRKG
jgi:ABC-type glycerol-3-phosphate transport system permease component